MWMQNSSLFDPFFGSDSSVLWGAAEEREQQRQQVEEAIPELGRSHQNTSRGGRDSNNQLV